MYIQRDIFIIVIFQRSVYKYSSTTFVLRLNGYTDQRTKQKCNFKLLGKIYINSRPHNLIRTSERPLHRP